MGCVMHAGLNGNLFEISKTEYPQRYTELLNEQLNAFPNALTFEWSIFKLIVKH